MLKPTLSVLRVWWKVEYFLLKWCFGDAVSADIPQSSDGPIHVNSSFGVLQLKPVRRVEKRPRAWWIEREMHGYMVQDPPKELLYLTKAGVEVFLKGETPTEAIASLHVLVNLGKDLQQALQQLRDSSVSV